MSTWAKNFQQHERTIQGQMAAAVTLAQKSGIPIHEALSPYVDMLREMYKHDLPLVQVMDESDLVVRFNGPAIEQGNPPADMVADALNGLYVQIVGIARSIVGLAGFNANDKLPDQLDPRLVGLAKGSLIVGLKFPDPLAASETRQLAIPETIMPMVLSVKQSVRRLPLVARYIEEDRMGDGIRQRLRDPAERDALIVAASKIAPSGKKGITEVQIFGGPSSRKPTPVLTSRSRTVLHRAVISPLSESKFGSFNGTIRSADLDAFRFEIRNVSSYGSIRCVYRPELEQKIKLCFDHLAEVSGNYDTDATGAPRLLVVDDIKPLRKQHFDNPLFRDDST